MRDEWFTLWIAAVPAKNPTDTYTIVMTMWLLNRKEENSNDTTTKGSSTETGGNNNSNSSSSSSKPRGLSKWRKKLASPRNGTTHTMAETYSGIEVSLSNEESSISNGRGVDEDVRTMSSTPTDTSFSTVLSLKDHMDDLKRVCILQFSVPRPEVPMAFPTSPAQSPSLSFKNSTRHRLPLFRSTNKTHETTTTATSPEQRKLGHDSVVIQLLRKAIPTNELALFKQEIALLDDELACINSDREELEKCMIPPPSPTSISELELHRTLNHNGSIASSHKLALHRRMQLQNERGVHLTVRLSNSKTLDSLLSKCAYKSHSPSRSTGNHSIGGSPIKSSSSASATTPTLSIGPHNCRDGGAAATIQHLALLKLSEAIKDGTGFFMSRDNGKTYHSSPLPERLQRRLKNAGLDATKDLNYLSVGPHPGYYYAEFRNGTSWWGSASDDLEFDKFCEKWDIHRVVFGPLSLFDVGAGNTNNAYYKMVPSWIILARDGKVAWKNIPSRLQSQLVGRTGDLAPTEIALGPNGSYFVRYLDGSLDWQLPANISDVCESLEKEGRTIMSMFLHPEVSQDFIIRHR